MLVTEEFVQGLMFSFISWLFAESDVYKNVCHLAKQAYPEYIETFCLDTITSQEIQSEIKTYVYHPESDSPSPGVILVSGSSKAQSDSMLERKKRFLDKGFSVMILDSYTRTRVLEDCFSKNTPCQTYQVLSGEFWNSSMPVPSVCPSVESPINDHWQSVLLKNYLSKVTRGTALAPAERARDLYEALNEFRKDERVDANNIAIIGYSHGGSVVLEALTLSGNEIAPPGDDVYSNTKYSLKGVKAATVYYPNCRPGTYFERHANIGNIDLQIHLADQDEYVRPEICLSVIDRMVSEHETQLKVHHYDNRHAFDMKEYGAAYNETSKELSFKRTLEFTCKAIDLKYHPACITD